MRSDKGVINRGLKAQLRVRVRGLATKADDELSTDESVPRRRPSLAPVRWLERPDPDHAGGHRDDQK